MPQAPNELRAKFEDDRVAWDVLKDNFIDHRGLIKPKPGYVPNDRDFEAIDYLVLEWDYAYGV